LDSFTTQVICTKNIVWTLYVKIAFGCVND